MARHRRRRPLYWLMHADHSVEPVEDQDALVWGRAFAKCDRRVAQHWWVVEIDGVRAGIRVSTVFIGLDHRHWGSGPALIFESMIFGGPHGGDQRRYATWDEAEAGHGDLVERERRWLDGLGTGKRSPIGTGARGSVGSPSWFADFTLARVVAEGSGDRSSGDGGDG